MSDILFIKMSSLGDVIHHLPALTDARRRRPDARFGWIVEEAFAPLVRLHPAVSDVFPVAWRRWWGNFYTSADVRSEIGATLSAVRARRYDAIVDSQGLMRSAGISRLARGRRHGYDRNSIREKVASIGYDVRHRIGRELHAVERNRILTGEALGYVPDGAPDYGLERARPQAGARRYAVLLHATARAEKQWPQENWIALGKALETYDVDLVLPWGNEAERARSERIAAALPRGHVGEREPLDKVARLIGGAEFVVGVDTGLLHLAAAFGVPLVAVFTGSQPALTGPVGAGPIELTGSNGQPPSVETVARAVGRVMRSA